MSTAKSTLLKAQQLYSASIISYSLIIGPPMEITGFGEVTVTTGGHLQLALKANHDIISIA